MRLACGTGKTLIMCIAAFEMKRLGLANKPMIIGLKSNVHDIADTFKRAYPNARVLYPGKEDFTPEKRVGIFHDIKNNNWDCIILTHDQFGKIPQSPEIQQKIYTQEIDKGGPDGRIRYGRCRPGRCGLCGQAQKGQPYRKITAV